MQQEIHPFQWFVPEGSRVLVVGTSPPTKRNWSYDFFYPNKRNLFWRVMAAVAGISLQHFSGAEAVEERKQLLEKLKAGITDMGHTITRINDSSLDEHLGIVTYMDILSILDNHPSINKIIFTSSSGPVSAAKWFNNYLTTQNILHKFPKGIKPVRSSFGFKGRVIHLSVLYSPSARAANRISFEQMVAMYSAEILS